MNKLILIIVISLINIPVLSSEVEVIELHNKSIDQLLIENIEKSKEIEIISTDENIINNQNIQNNADSESENFNQEDQLTIETIETIETIDEIDNLQNEISSEDVPDMEDMWKKFEGEDLVFLLQNITKIKSLVLKEELLAILNIRNSIPKNFDSEDFNKIVIDSLLSLGDREKTYQIIQSFQDVQNNDYQNFYKEFELNYLLSNYKLSEACDFRNEIKKMNLKNVSNFFLKVDIFCLILLEKFDEANLLHSLLNETAEETDEYFQYLFNKLQNIETLKHNKNILINKNNIFLYSAMHRVGNVAMTEEFLSVDPLNLSMPIILSSSTDIELRLKAAHLAYFNNLLNTDSLSALYQTVDFSFEELSNPLEIISKLNNNVELGMAYFYQLINIQLLPITRLEAILKFWEFAELNELELIAYQISIKNLNTILPTEQFSSFGPKIARAYTYSDNRELAQKWLLFSENVLEKEEFLYELNSSKLLFNLFNINYDQNFKNVLHENLQYMNQDLVNKDNSAYIVNNEILHLIFSILNKDKLNPFEIEKKIDENRLMPSSYIINNIRSSLIDNNQPELLLLIIASINEKKWSEIHPEHLRLILNSLNYYKEGFLLNSILLEILKQSKII